MEGNNAPLRAVADNEGTFTLPFEVSEALYPVLDSQRDKLDTVDPKQPGRQRYESAREAGCFAAVSKGAKDRELKPAAIYIPRTELTHHKDATLRISALKLNIPDVVVDVRGVTLIRENGTWTGRLEVKEAEAA